jgi:outer membrane protein assembly factor BamB
MEAIGFGYEDGIRCYDTATGKIKWHIDAPPGGFAGAASADLNSDGRDEALLSANNTLYCYGGSKDGSAGKVLWKVQFPTTIGPPAIADVSGDGNLEILVVGYDGNLYCVK